MDRLEHGAPRKRDLPQISTPASRISVAIVGGGWAGLAAGVQLAQYNIPVTLLEAAKQLGGRARCAPFGPYRVDCGQHILLGSYTHILGMLKIIATNPDDVILRRPFRLAMRELPKGKASVRALELPAPLHLLASFMFANGLTILEKQRATQFCAKIIFGKIRIKQDVSVEALLIRHRQSGRLASLLWEPLCLAILNTAIRNASAQSFIHVLTSAFTETRQFSDILFARDSLCKVFPEPAMEFIERHSGTVQLQKRVTGIEIDQNGVRGIVIDDEIVDVDYLILALPAHAIVPLIQHKPHLNGLTKKLQQFDYTGTTTIYLQYPETVTIGETMMTVSNGMVDWLFDRKDIGQPGVIAAVIHDGSKHEIDNEDELEKKVIDEIAALFPKWPAPTNIATIHEPRAAFACYVGVNEVRPPNTTDIGNLYIAGDFTDTGEPGTLESAVISGVNCGRLLAKKLANHHP